MKLYEIVADSDFHVSDRIYAENEEAALREFYKIAMEHIEKNKNSILSFKLNEEKMTVLEYADGDLAEEYYVYEAEEEY